MQYFFSTNITNDKIILSKEESIHCIAVLRHIIGDMIYVVDGRGNEFLCEIINLENKNVELKIVKKEQKVERSGFYIHIAIAPTKSNKRLEWFIEKAVEIGIDEISFMECSNSERKKINISRLNKVALTAMKQSLKASLPKINDMNSFEGVIGDVSQNYKYIGYLEDESAKFLGHIAPLKKDYCLLIGPEGDFSKKEFKMALEYNFTQTSLGHSRLRTETAGITGCMILNAINTI